MDRQMMKHIICFLAVVLFLYVGCAPQQFVVQHAEKGRFSSLYKHLGVYCDHADVHLHGWNRDSVSIAVTMEEGIKNDYSFLVDSSGDSLLLIGKRGVAGAAGNNSLPEVDVALPFKTDAVIRTDGNIIIDSVNGRVDAVASGTLSYACMEWLSPVDLRCNGIVTLNLPHDIACNLDLECSENGQIRFDSQDFKGERQRNIIKGTMGAGGMLLKAVSKEGVNVLLTGK
jgi:hypothetical protein